MSLQPNSQQSVRCSTSFNTSLITNTLKSDLLNCSANTIPYHSQFHTETISTNQSLSKHPTTHQKTTSQAQTLSKPTANQQKIEQNHPTNHVANKKQIIKPNILIYVGKNVQIPYLHSQDVLNKMYIQNQQTKNIYFDINPTPSPNQLLNITMLCLYSCNFSSLRQLGTGWLCLRIISIMNCQLVDLWGVGGLGKLQEMYLGFNRIRSIQEVAYLDRRIKCLDLEENLIGESEVEWLEMMVDVQRRCGLKHINLLGNPVWNNKLIRRKIIEKLGEQLFVNSLFQQKQQQIYQLIHAQSHDFYWQQYHRIQSSNSLIKNINQQQHDSITAEDCLNHYRGQVYNQLNQSPIQIVNYKNQMNSIQQCEPQVNITPLIHFLPTQHTINSQFFQYLSNKLIIHPHKKQQPIINTVRLQKMANHQQQQPRQKQYNQSIDKKQHPPITKSLRVRKYNQGTIKQHQKDGGGNQMSATTSLDKRFLERNEFPKQPKLGLTCQFEQKKSKAESRLLGKQQINNTLAENKGIFKSLNKKILPKINIQHKFLINQKY